MLVLSAHPHVIGIQGKVRTRRGVLSDPHECFDPRVSGAESGKFEVVCGGEELALRIEHACRDGQKQHEPSPQFTFQDVFSQLPAANHKQENIYQQQSAHRLQFGETHKWRWNGDDQRCRQAQKTENDAGQAEPL